MNKTVIANLLAAAAIGMSAGAGRPFNPAYTSGRDKQYAAQAKAAEKRKRVREEIRARKKAKGVKT